MWRGESGGGCGKVQSERGMSARREWRIRCALAVVSCTHSSFTLYFPTTPSTLSPLHTHFLQSLHKHLLVHFIGISQCRTKAK